MFVDNICETEAPLTEVLSVVSDIQSFVASMSPKVVFRLHKCSFQAVVFVFRGCGAISVLCFILKKKKQKKKQTNKEKNGIVFFVV